MDKASDPVAMQIVKYLTRVAVAVALVWLGYTVLKVIVYTDEGVITGRETRCASNADRLGLNHSTPGLFGGCWVRIGDTLINIWE